MAISYKKRTTIRKRRNPFDSSFSEFPKQMEESGFVYYVFKDNKGDKKNNYRFQVYRLEKGKKPFLLYTSKLVGIKLANAIIESRDFRMNVLDHLFKAAENAERFSTRKNPENADDFISLGDSKSFDIGPLGIPRDPLKAFDLGRIMGLKAGLNYCDLRKILQRRKLKQHIDDQMNKWMNSLNRQVNARQAGLVGVHVPMSGGKSNAQ